MDDCPVPNSNYALQLALQTMKERCMQLQKRVATLQEENIVLKANSPQIHDNISHNSLEIKVSKLTEERNQLKNTITMVASENKQLWSSLSRLTHDSKSFGSKIDNLSPNEKTHMPLIRSRTFTQEAPHTKHLHKVLSENDKVSLELEDISLKLQNDEANHINEDVAVPEIDITSLEGSLDSLGFNYLEDEDIDDSLSDCIEQHLIDLKNIKVMLTHHNDKLRTSVDHLIIHKLDLETSKELQEKRKLERCATKTIQVNIEDEERELAKEKEKEESKISEQQHWGTPDSSLKLDRNSDKICPMCNQKFHFDVDFDVFTRHVEEHFLDNNLLRL